MEGAPPSSPNYLPKAPQPNTITLGISTSRHKFGSSQVVLVVKNPPASAGDLRDAGLIPGSGRFPGGGHLATHSSILAWRIPMDRGVWWATVHGVAKSQT